MAEPCAKRNPLVRSGMTQEARRRAELSPGHFLPDERELADLILFGQRYARHIQYYDAGNARAGDWSAFFESDVSAVLAALAKLPVEAFRDFQRDLEAWLKDGRERPAAQLEAHAKLLFHLPLALLNMAGQLHARLPADHPLREEVAALAAQALADPLTGLIAWYKGAVEVPGAGNALFADTPLQLADYNTAGGAGDARVRMSATVAAALAGQPRLGEMELPGSLMARIAPGTWTGLYAVAGADSSPYVDAIGAPHQRYEQVYDALSYNLLASAVQRIYQVAERIRRDATRHLQQSLTEFAGHAPHYGLWLAFLQLFQHAKGELNAFTARHLDFYFRDVLRLRNRPAAPDKVHLLFELARGQSAHLLLAGTRFGAGKDAQGKAVSYALENDIVVSRASVAELRGLLVQDLAAAAVPAQLPRAALAVQSRDGAGAQPLLKDDPAWPPFGPAASPTARVGFAVRDRKLFLREGRRSIVLRAELDRALPDGIAPRWTVRLSGDKGWFELTGTAQIRTRIDNRHLELDDDDEETRYAPAANRTVRQEADGRAGGKPGKSAAVRQDEHHMAYHADDARQGPAQEREARRKRPGRAVRLLEITVTLRPDDPPVVPLTTKLHGSEHLPGAPAMEIAFDFSGAEAARAFAALRDVTARRLTLMTEASGLKNLMLVAGGSIADPARPFAPFGAQPAAGAALVIGSSEIFSKPIAEWALTLDWQVPYSTTGFFWYREAGSYNATESVLSGGRWIDVDYGKRRQARRYGRGRPLPGFATTDIALGETDAEVEMRGAGLIDGLAAQTPDNPPLDARAVNGFVRLRLPRDFGHAAFVRENARALVGLAGGAAYAPGAAVNITADGTLPREPYTPVITRIEASYATTRDTVEGHALLHPFGISPGQERRLFPDFPFQGALLVGVRDLAPPARLTLLVQVADGSGDPLRQAPPLQFHYLAGDSWRGLDAQDVDDKTRNFTGSGVLGLSLPAQADTEHRILPAGLHWLRISAAQDADAFNRLLSIDAQAARAVFVDAGNDPARLVQPLPAGSIVKPVAADPALKRVTQPYASFGGRPAEEAPAFAARVSERLRHKDRAVTLWDYEALVLEAFPGLFRVKCLNTTRLVRDARNAIVADNEMLPGAVTVVVVPYTHGQAARDPLRPYADQATLQAVDAFLRRRVSPFVRLEAQNPKFEEVMVDFKVKFQPSIGDIAFYLDALNQAVVRFLTPWLQPGGAEITFGGRLWKSTLIDFVEERPEVDYVTDFRLYHKADVEAPAGSWSPVDMDVVEATTARSILVSAPRHTITEVSGDA